MSVNKLISLGLILLLTGCAATQASKQKAAMYQFDELQQVNSISHFRLDSWRSIDSRSLFIDVRPRQSYLLVLDGIDNNLQFAQALLVSSKLGTVEAGFDTVSTAAEPQFTTRIKSIYRIDDKQQEQQVKQKIAGFSAVKKP
ncbi:DUF6491 family protein [Shewanella sp. 10N.286.48.A6]|uniref:DUF6491 family protein n=1 Tax=Shewanella sp. 10N.286.48.A6 TaxID=1880833 RepID=UPI000C84B9D8|nr:DUF6491 family protein [Shewanella sp. 10N.286.48.A6]PMI01861.1 hypothetical protein BCU55_09265 [Shewanella sp. 10N.286.48.A6]